MSMFFIQTTIKAPVSKGYAAWTEAEQLQQWFTKSAEVDLRVDGEYRNADGDCGRFLTIEPEQQLQFTWDNPKRFPGTIVEIEFTKIDEDRHQVSLTHTELPSREQAREMGFGWEWAFDSLSSWLENGTPVSLSEWKKKRAANESELLEGLQRDF